MQCTILVLLLLSHAVDTTAYTRSLMIGVDPGMATYGLQHHLQGIGRLHAG